MTPAQLVASAQHVLEHNILSFWANRMYDPEGGFYGRMDGAGVLHPEAERGAVLNARILWAFAAAYRVLRKPEYLAMATHAKHYIEAHFLDHQQGGAFWALRADGSPLDTKKQTYAVAFMLYAFAEYARATGDVSALSVALTLFEDIEAHAYDDRHQGYVEARTRHWEPVADMRLSDKDENAVFTMNTHLHVLEAYTNLFRVWPHARLRGRLMMLVRIFTERLYNPASGHIDLFFNEHWQGKRDIASYGHDIEAAWLIGEALDVLRDNAFSEHVKPVLDRIARAAEEGLRPDGSMIHERKATPETHSVSQGDEREWWVMCEATVGFIDRWQSTADKRYWNIAVRTYRYALDHLIDHDHGEWFWAVLPDGTTDTANDKAGFWKCPYHNSRMCLELIERL